MKIVQIISSVSIGGAERLMVVFAQMARQRGLEVTVISLATPGEKASYADQIQQQGARLVFFPAPRLLDFGRIAALTRFLRRERFDLAHTHLNYGNILGVAAARLAGLPVVSTLHSTGNNHANSNAGREFLETTLLRFFTHRLIAVGYKVEEMYRPRLGNRPMEIIPNAVLLAPTVTAEERIRLRVELAGSTDRLILLTAGRFAPPKALDDLVRAFALLHERVPHTILIMVGEGPLFAQIAALVQEMGLGDAVRLLGPRQDVPLLMAAADVYASSSLREGLPMAVLEAMMAGLPVVATAVGDLPRLLQPGRGLLVPPANPPVLAEALEKMAKNAQLRETLGAAARQFVQENFSAEAWMDRLLAVYGDVLRSRSQVAALHES
ncbi:MAG: glycosyltransferase [Anaerolineae bacterium]